MGRRPSFPVLFCPSRASLFLLSSSVLCLWSFNGVVDHVQGGMGGCGAGRDGGVGGGAGVTAVDPPSLTVRTPSPHPLHPGLCCAVGAGSSDCGPHLRNSGGKPLHSV